MICGAILLVDFTVAAVVVGSDVFVDVVVIVDVEVEMDASDVVFTDVALFLPLRRLMYTIFLYGE